uniref:ATP-dependent RNA helicase n=1 Tax=Erythrolobus australicus TaxID=1077150 RepID=A0A7S1TMT7_9RHOD|mmetsp:Transcript_4820/g.12924  ORF Transcript_4820/g.12924 Transcript_4820/m.12924 type:complete len:888 (+) Transcript_4820:79-2742(+)
MELADADVSLNLVVPDAFLAASTAGAGVSIGVALPAAAAGGGRRMSTKQKWQLKRKQRNLSRASPSAAGAGQSGLGGLAGAQKPHGLRLENFGAASEFDAGLRQQRDVEHELKHQRQLRQNSKVTLDGAFATKAQPRASGAEVAGSGLGEDQLNAVAGLIASRDTRAPPQTQPREDAETRNAFEDAGLNPSLARHLVHRMGLRALTTVQQRCLAAYFAGAAPPNATSAATSETSVAQPASTAIFNRHIDLLVRSETGSGKTLAYLLPIAHTLLVRKKRVDRAEGSIAIVLAPTRELVAQVERVAEKLFHPWHWIVVGAIMGGEKKKSEKSRLRKGLSIVIATPGRLLDHIRNTRSFVLSKVQFLVLDEADRLMDLGFEDDLLEIIRSLDAAQCATVSSGASTRTNILVSATLPNSVQQLAKVALHDPVTVTVERGLGASVPVEDRLTAEKRISQADDAPRFEAPKNLRQHYCLVDARRRLVTLIAFLRLKSQQKSAKTIVFFSSCDSVDFHHALFQVARLPPVLQEKPALFNKGNAAAGGKLNLLGDEESAASTEAGDTLSLAAMLCPVPVLRIHGNMEQKERIESWREFCRLDSGVLFCTDVASRGLDLPNLTLSLQYDPPTRDEVAEYVHRAGRTARIGCSGDALLFLLPSETEYINVLEKTGLVLKEVSSDAALAALLLSAKKARYNEVAESGKLEKVVRVATTSLQRAIISTVEGRRAGPPHDSESDQDAAAALRQKSVSRSIVSDESSAELQNLAANGFRAYCRAYATHSKSTRHIFHIRNIHLGHAARSFGLRRSPAELDALLRYSYSSPVEPAQPRPRSGGSKAHDASSRKRTRERAHAFSGAAEKRAAVPQSTLSIRRREAGRGLSTSARSELLSEFGS